MNLFVLDIIYSTQNNERRRFAELFNRAKLKRFYSFAVEILFDEVISLVADFIDIPFRCHGIDDVKKRCRGR
jgi:hypothetical protein